MFKYLAAGAFAAFVVSGPLQHVGVLPETVVGDLSKQSIKLVLGRTVKDAYGRCGGGGNRIHGNNGFGNGGLDGIPGGSNKQDATR